MTSPATMWSRSAGPPAAAAALSATTQQLTCLTVAEQVLLTQWLDRVTDATTVPGTD